jgi:hypothetical protein
VAQPIVVDAHLKAVDPPSVSGGGPHDSIVTQYHADPIEFRVFFYRVDEMLGIQGIP